MATLEKGSERFNQFTQKRWVKLMVLVFVGGGLGKLTYEQVLAKKSGIPSACSASCSLCWSCCLLVLLQSFAAGPIVSAALQRGLERANGATVDLENAELDLKSQRLTITGLAMADPNALDTDMFRATKIEAQISGANLLRKRLQLDRVIVSGASSGDSRPHPGRLVGPPPQPIDPEPVGDAKTLDDYLREAKIWKERLAQARRWLEKLSGPAEPETETPETLRERLERQARELGYSRVRALHLIEGSPTFAILELDRRPSPHGAELTNETLSITASNLSTHPALLGKTPPCASIPAVRPSSSRRSWAASPPHPPPIPQPELPRFAHRPGRRGPGGWRNAANLGRDDRPGLQGTWEIRNGVQVNLPLQATLKQVTLPTQRAANPR
jgi:hypothetical protein